MERKRELDATKNKMDHLIERLYGHREASMSLSGAIAAAADYQQVSMRSRVWCCLVCWRCCIDTFNGVPAAPTMQCMRARPCESYTLAAACDARAGHSIKTRAC